MNRIYNTTGDKFKHNTHTCHIEDTIWLSLQPVITKPDSPNIPSKLTWKWSMF